MTIHKVEEVRGMAREILRTLAPQGRASVVTLSGDLGAGKTTLVQAMAQELGISEHVVSPTFVIERVYALPRTSRGFERLIHIDAYRLEDESELEHLGWKEMVADPHNLILIEWPERVSSLIPDDAQHITFSYVDEMSRNIEYGN